MRVAVACNAPQLKVAVVAVVHNAHTAINMAADGGSSSRVTAQVLIVLIHGVVTIVEQVRANIVHVLVVVLVVVPRATFFS